MAMVKTSHRGVSVDGLKYLLQNYYDWYGMHPRKFYPWITIGRCYKYINIITLREISILSPTGIISKTYLKNSLPKYGGSKFQNHNRPSNNIS